MSILSPARSTSLTVNLKPAMAPDGRGLLPRLGSGTNLLRKLTAGLGMKKELDMMLPRVRQVVSQTRARIIHGITNSAGKIVSLFEHTTEIIRKGKPGKPTEFGKMIKVQEAENQIIVAFQVYDKRPADSALLIPAIEQHQQR